MNNVSKSLQGKDRYCCDCSRTSGSRYIGNSVLFRDQSPGTEELEQVGTLMMQIAGSVLKSYIDHALTAIVHLEKER